MATKKKTKPGAPANPQDVQDAADQFNFECVERYSDEELRAPYQASEYLMGIMQLTAELGANKFHLRFALRRIARANGIPVRGED